MMKKIALCVLLTLTLAGCRSTTISPPRALIAKHATNAIDLEEAIKRGVVLAGWKVEQATDRFVVAGFTHGSHYVQVTYTISNNQVISTLSNSKNLRQSDHKIHKHAIGWKKRVDRQVARQI